jgi:hypothetical protein
MRHFFNQGGYLYIYGSASGGTSPDKTNTFVELTRSIGFTLTKNEYRAGTGAGQNLTTAVAPYSGGTPSSLTANFIRYDSTAINWVFTANDTGSEDGDADGIVVNSTIDVDLTFYVIAYSATGTGITDYKPAIY